MVDIEEIENNNFYNLKKTIISKDPLIYTIDNFITNHDCEHFIKISKEDIKPSLVSGDKEGYVSKGRTGQNHWVPHDTDMITKRIGDKISNIVGINLGNAEAYQVIYYNQSQEYRQHYDGWLFDGSDRSKRNMKYGGQRLITALVYLSDVESGGGTKFTKLNIEVKAEKGKLLVFENVHSGTNKRHELSEHAGMPVIEGEKWAFNLWFREGSRKKIYDYSVNLEEEPVVKVDKNLPLNLLNILDKINFVLVDGKKDIENSNTNISENKNIVSSENKNIVSSENNNIVSSENNNIESCEIKSFKKLLSIDDMKTINMNCFFEDKKRSVCWVGREKIPEIIRKIEELIKIDGAYFENMCVTKYSPMTNHCQHYDAYDMTTAKGIENTSGTGQRLMTITGFLSETKVKFTKLNEEFNMEKGDLLVYYNCYNESNKRNDKMEKSYTNLNILDEGSSMLLFNIYVREKSRTKTGILKISNGLIESNIESKENEIKNSNISSEELINIIYKGDLSESLTIPGFKIVSKAPVDYLVDTLLKIKILRDNLSNNFLNVKNLEKDYFIDEYNPVIVEDVISPEIHSLIDEYFKTNIKNGVYPFGDRQSQRYKIIDEIMTRLLHLEFLPLIEKIVGKKMEATYTYISAYVKGAELPAHTDRPECEYTCSYIIGKPPNTNWNIYVHKVKQPVKYKGRYAKFENGDPGYTPPKEECLPVDCRENGLMIFNGTDHIHFREPLEHEYYNIVLLHYCSKVDTSI